MKEFLKNNWQRIICILAAVVTIVFCFFRPLQFKCGAETYIKNRPASDWGISKNSTASKYFDATNFSKFDEYLVNTLKIPAYSYGNFKYNLGIVIQLAMKDDLYNDFLADWAKVEAGTLDRRKVVTFGTFDTDLLVYKVEYLGTELYTDACLVYPVSNNQEEHFFGNYKVLNFKVTFNFGQSYNSQYRDVVWKEYSEVSILYQLTGCTGSTSNPTTIYQNSKDVPLSFSLQDGYTWEGAELLVNGLAFTWNDGFMFVDALPNVTDARIAITAKKVDPASYTLDAGTYIWSAYLNWLQFPFGDYLNLDNFIFNSNSTDFGRMLLKNNAPFAGITYYPPGGGSIHAFDGRKWIDPAYRTIVLSSPQSVPKDFYLWAIMDGNLVKQPDETLQSDSPVLLAETSTTIVSVIRDSPYNITISPEFPTLKSKFLDTWNEREFGYRITRADITFSGASRPQWVKPASGTAPTAYHVVLANIMEYLAYYGYNKATAEGELYFTSYFSSGGTRYWYGESAPIGYNHSNFYDKFIRIDAFDGLDRSFFIDGYSIYLVGNGKDSYGDFGISGSSGKDYQLFNYYRESDTENSCDYPYSFEYYPLVSDNFGVSIGAGTGDIQGYDYNQFYMPLDDFNFFDLFKGSTWYAILNNSIVWLCCELPLLSNLTRPLYTAARLTSNYLVQYIIPFFSATGILGAGAGFVILISVIWRWIKGND